MIKVFAYLITIKNRITTFIPTLLIDKEKRNAAREQRKQKKNISKRWSECKDDLTKAKNLIFLDKLEKSKLLIVAICAIWLSNLINLLSFYTEHNEMIRVAFWIVNASFYVIPASTGISLLFALIIMICVALSTLKKKMEKTGVYITNRKLGIILKNHYIAWFFMCFFTTFILSIAIHSIDTVHWVSVILLTVGYNLFITTYSYVGTFMFLFLNYIASKFSDYIIDDINPPQEVTT